MVARPVTRRSFVRGAALGAAGALLAACGATPTPQVIEKVVEKEVTKVIAQEVTRIVEGTAQVVIETVVVKETVVVEAPTAAQPVGEVVEIRFQDESGAGPDGFKVFTDSLLPTFEKLNPGIKVGFEPAVGDWVQKVMAQMAAGEAPDVLVAYGDFARGWMEAGQLLPLEESFAADELSDFYDSQLNAFTIEGHLYEIPKYVAIWALAYNKDLFDAAGLAYPNDDWGWSEFLAAAEALTKRDADGRASQWGYRVMPWGFQGWAWSNGGEWMNADVMGTRILIDEPKTMEALKFNWDIQYTYKYAPAPQEVDQISEWDTFQTGKLGLNMSPSWQATDYILRNNFNYDYALMPKGSAGRVGHIFADGYGIYKGSKNLDAALTFLRFITGPEAEREMCTSALGLQPSRKSVASVWDTLSQGAKASLNVRTFSEMSNGSRIDPYFKDQAKVSEIFYPLWESIWITGTMGLEEGVAEIVQRVNEYLATVA